MKNPFHTCLLLLLALGSASMLGAQEKSAVAWNLSLSQSGLSVGDEVDVVITARIAPDWIVYSTDFKADIGPQPTQVLFAPSDSWQVVGPVISVQPKRKKDRTWDIEFGYFEEHAEFRQKIRILKKDVAITVRIKGQLCNEREGICTLYEEKLAR